MLNHYNLAQFSFHFSVHWLTQSLLTPNTVYLGLKYRCWQMSSGLAKTKNWTYVLTAAMMSWWMLHVSKLVVINKSSPYKQSSYSTQWQLQLPNFHEIHQISWCLCNQNMSIDFHVLAKYIDKLLFTLKYKENKYTQCESNLQYIAWSFMLNMQAPKNNTYFSENSAIQKNIAVLSTTSYNCA